MKRLFDWFVIFVLVISVVGDPDPIPNPNQDNSGQSTTNAPLALPRQYDIKNLPSELSPIGFLLGKWRSEFDGKIRFPTIPIFTYGEEIDISISERPSNGPASLNYSAFAWGINNQESLHSENGFIVMKDSSRIALSTTMLNGFVTVEEGEVIGRKINFKLIDIGRISWSRDLPVLDLRREYELIDDRTMDQRLMMETLTNQLQEHAYIRYKKIYPPAKR